MATKYKSTFYILILIIILSSNYIFSFRCGKNKLKIKPKKMKSSNIKRKLSTLYTPIKIKVDYTYLNSQKLLSDDNLSKLQTVLAETITAFSTLLQVKHQNVDLDADEINEYCDIPKVASDYKNFLYDYDILILPYIDENADESVLAAATACLMLNDYQPKVGVLALTSQMEFDKKDINFYFRMLLLHEITHILIFDPEILGNIGMLYSSNNLYYVKSAKVLELAKKHYGCNSINGIQLEDQGDDGSAGSHWEARYMLGDYMIAFDYPEIVISDISLALFEDSGWYKVNYYTGGLFKFGRKTGCDFLNTKCLKGDGWETNFPNEFCTSGGDAFCSNAHLSRGDCYLVEYTSKIPNTNYRYFNDPKVGGLSWANYCPVSQDYDETEYDEYYYPNNCKWGEVALEKYGEKIGDNSLCFESSLVPKNSGLSLSEKKSICYEMKCSDEKVVVYIGNNEISCPKNGGVITNPSGFSGEINCPKYSLICSSSVWCNDALDCINKKSVSADINDDNNNSGWISFLIRNKIIILIGIFILLF